MPWTVVPFIRIVTGRSAGRRTARDAEEAAVLEDGRPARARTSASARTRAVDTNRKRGCPPTSRMSPPTRSQRTPASSPSEPLASEPERPGRPRRRRTARAGPGRRRRTADRSNRRTRRPRRPWSAARTGASSRRPATSASAARASTSSSGYSQIALEQDRRDDRDERAREDATGRHHEVELGQVLGGWSIRGEPSVERRRDDAEPEELDQQERPDRPAGGRPERDPQQGDGRRREPLGTRDDPAAPLGERDHERQQVDRERDDPQERGRDEIGRDEVRDGRQEPGRDRGQQQPAPASPPVDRLGGHGARREAELGARRPGGGSRAERDVGTRCRTSQAQPSRQADEDARRRRPRPSAGRSGRAPARRGTGRRAGPRTSRRCSARTASTGRPGWPSADRIAANHELSSGVVAVIRSAGAPIVTKRIQTRFTTAGSPTSRRSPIRAGAASRAATASTREDDVDDRPAAGAEPRRRQVAVGVADEEHRLEEEQDRGPDRGRPAERRQGQPADQRLDREEQERRQRDRRRERRQDGRWPARRARVPTPRATLAWIRSTSVVIVPPRSHGDDGRPRLPRTMVRSAHRAAAVGQAGRGVCRAASANSPLKIRDVDGKAWIVSARTSTVTRALIARTHSWMAAEASGQAMRRADELAARPIDDDRHVAEIGLDGVALGRGRERRRHLERIAARARAPRRG